MALSKHHSLDNYYVSTHGEWAFDIDEDGNIDAVDEAIAAWQEWREFLVTRERNKDIEELNLDG